MWVCFFFHMDIVHWEFLEQAWTVNQHCIRWYWWSYLKLFIREDLYTFVWCWDRASWQCPCSWHALCKEVFGLKINSKFGHPPYLPDWDQWFFWQFPKLWLLWRLTDLQIASMVRDMMIILRSRLKEGCQHCFEEWKHWLTKYIAVKGNCFKGHRNCWCVSN